MMSNEHLAVHNVVSAKPFFRQGIFSRRFDQVGTRAPIVETPRKLQEQDLHPDREHADETVHHPNYPQILSHGFETASTLLCFVHPTNFTFLTRSSCGFPPNSRALSRPCVSPMD